MMLTDKPDQRTGPLKLSTVRPTAEHVLVAVFGEITARSVPSLAEFVETRLRGTLTRVTLDLSAVTSIDDSGLSCLVRAGLVARCRGTELRFLAHGNTSVQQRVTRAGLACTAIQAGL